MHIFRLSVVAVAAAAIFSIAPARAATFQTVYSVTHSADGAAPGGAPINVGGKLYGTAGGGAFGYGVVYRFDPASGKQTTLHSFAAGSDGARPYVGLVYLNGAVYGSTDGGPNNITPTLFKIDLATGVLTTLYTFPYNIHPVGALIELGGALYGTTPDGGAYGAGTVYNLNLATGKVTYIHSFTGNSGVDGGNPAPGLVAVGNLLYGTVGGLPAVCGSVFSIDPSTGAVQLVYSFKGGTDGCGASGALINVNGVLYGTTGGGGVMGGYDGYGVVFSINPATGAETVLYRFKGQPDAQIPNTALVNFGNTLYGTTYSGGASYQGTVYSVDIATGAEAVLYSFPAARLAHLRRRLSRMSVARYTALPSMAARQTRACCSRSIRCPEQNR